MRFAEVSGFWSGVATTTYGNVAAKDMPTMSTEEKILKTEVLRLVFCKSCVLAAWVVVEGHSWDLWGLWISKRKTFLKYSVSIIYPCDSRL